MFIGNPLQDLPKSSPERCPDHKICDRPKIGRLYPALGGQFACRNTIVFKAIIIKGVYGREIFDTWYKMIAMLENGLDIRPVITHRFAADDFAQGFEIMRSGRSGKVVLDWG